MSLKHIHTFIYKKDDKETPSEKKVLVLGEDSTYLEGLSMNSITEEDKTALLSLISKFNDDLQPYVRKYFRKFLKEKITSKITSDEIFKKSTN